MQVEEELAAVSPEKDSLLTVGVFDGVHLGHRHLISRLVSDARQQNLNCGVVTFKHHPEEVLSPRTKISFLTTLEDRIRLIQSEGVAFVVALTFTPEMAALSARDFVSLLKKHLRMRGLVVGPDFALGRNKEGNISVLRRLGEEMGFNVTVVPPLVIDGAVVSSSAIRQALAEGDIVKANKLFGRPYSLSAQVVPGDRRGTGLGVPTANMDVSASQVLPADGVYATWAYLNGKGCRSVTNIGMNPTFKAQKRTIEVHLLDYNQDIYGRNLKIEIVARLRGEKKFHDAAELTRQIAEDIRQSRTILSTEVKDEQP